MKAPVPFKNEPFTDFSKPANREAFQKALQSVSKELGKTYPLWVGGEELSAKKSFPSTNPARPDEMIGIFQKADAAIAERAIEAAHAAFPAWASKNMEERAEYLFRAAELMRERKFALAAWMVLEVGKPWSEADADVAEAIDFLEYYGREALRLGQGGRVTPFGGEANEMRYVPLGVGVVIPPWNFPLAILTGMTSAALVCGNTVVLKPSSDAPAIAWQFMQIMRELKIPDGVLNFVTGSGEEAGETLVKHPLTRFISFTGSKAAGLRINKLAAEHQPGQKWIKRVIAEMGGKDAIIVEADADLDAAAQDVVASAYGFSGQKCSACSRVIVSEKIYGAFLEKIAEKTNALAVGNPRDPGTQVGPVVNRGASEKIRSYIGAGRKEGRLVAGERPVPATGHFIAPTVVADVSPRARLAQEEIFGPVLAVIKAGNYEEALDIANDTEYGLTGAVYTRSEDKISLARERFHVGNLYINRKCTGAMVGAHPFGGFNMSGTNSKAGGPDYLLLFTQAKAIARKI